MSGPMTLWDPDQPVPPDILDAPGGFAWWYVDAFDASGNGVVLIWSWGLPFLPGYLAARRAGRPQTPRSRPSLNVVTYRDGQPDFYLLQEYPEGQATWRRDAQVERWTLGDSHFTCRRRDARVELEGQLDCPVPGMPSRLQGLLQLEGPAVRIAHADGLPASVHGWNPISTPSRVRSHLQLAGRSVLELDGTAYFDRNASPRALDDLGIEHWIWGRSARPDQTSIVFSLHPPESRAPLAFSVQVQPDGAMRLVRSKSLRLDGARSGRFGMPFWDACELELSDGNRVRNAQERIIEDGPFYLRTLGRLAMGNDAPRESVTEWIRPDRVDRDWQRPLVQMRVHRAQQANSMWLPLFTGPRSGRWGRLIRSWGARP